MRDYFQHVTNTESNGARGDLRLNKGAMMRNQSALLTNRSFTARTANNAR
jgi:hypothetical protein